MYGLRFLANERTEGVEESGDHSLGSWHPSGYPAHYTAEARAPLQTYTPNNEYICNG